MTCSIMGCSRSKWARGFCSFHYHKWREQHLQECARFSTIEERFWIKVNIISGPVIRPELGRCWPWDSSPTSRGYGKFWFGKGRKNGRLSLAHRVAYIFTYGTIPDELLVLHRCDYRLCCRPDHLFLGTHKDNTQDMILKGRARWSL